jgi:dienelactone hydrolase
VDLIVKDLERRRDIPIRIYLPQAMQVAPVVLFSHGLGGSREGNSYLGKHWAARGYVSVFLQHPGSDTAVWRGEAKGHRMQAMHEAASGQNFLLRVKDVPAVLDQLDHWNKTDGHVLAGRLDLRKVGMSGHSFGAVTTQAVSGQEIERGKALFTDARIAAAVIMSPSSPKRGTPQAAFGKVSLPWMLMTGTKDTAPIGDIDIVWRSFPLCRSSGNTSWYFSEPNTPPSRTAPCRAILSRETRITIASSWHSAPLSGTHSSSAIRPRDSGSMVTDRNRYSRATIDGRRNEISNMPNKPDARDGLQPRMIRGVVQRQCYQNMIAFLFGVC